MHTLSKEKSKNSPDEFYNFLVSKGFKISRSQALVIWSAIFASEHKALLLEGPPGTGKTYITELINEYIREVLGEETEYLFYQCTYGTDETDLMYKIVPSPHGLEMREAILVKSLKMSRKYKTIVVLDEFDKTKPSADALLLDYLQNARVYIPGEGLVEGSKENLIVILTSNKFREFSEPLLRRVVKIDMDTMLPSDIYDILSKEVDKQIALFVTKTYVFLSSIGLNKTISIQELKEFAHAIKGAVNNPVVIYEYIISLLVKDPLDVEFILDQYTPRVLHNLISSTHVDVSKKEEYEEQEEITSIPQEVELKQASVSDFDVLILDPVDVISKDEFLKEFFEETLGCAKKEVVYKTIGGRVSKGTLYYAKSIPVSISMEDFKKFALRANKLFGIVGRLTLKVTMKFNSKEEFFTDILPYITLFGNALTVNYSSDIIDILGSNYYAFIANTHGITYECIFSTYFVNPNIEW